MLRIHAQELYFHTTLEVRARGEDAMNEEGTNGARQMDEDDDAKIGRIVYTTILDVSRKDKATYIQTGIPCSLGADEDKTQPYSI